MVAGFHYPCAEMGPTLNGPEMPYYAMSGEATFTFNSVDDNRVGLSYGLAHAKQDITVSLGINFTNPPSIGLAFGLSKAYYDVIDKACDSHTF